MRTRSKKNPLRCWPLLVLLLLTNTGVAAGADTSLDPVVADVVEMLQAGVAETVIIQWLESTGRRPADVRPEGMIALTEAKASERLITTLLQGVEDATGQAAIDSPSVSQELFAGAPETSRPPEASSNTVSGNQVELIADLRAKRVFTDEPEPDSPQEERWDVFLYLDGELLVWTRPTLKGDPIQVRRVVTAGRHEFRVVLQRYEELRSGWFYESLSVPVLVAFEAETGDSVELEVEMRRIWGLWRQRKDGGPLRYQIWQGEKILAENGGTGGDPDRWQPVCEDVKANFRDSDGVPKRFRSQMSRCVRWADLWTGSGQSTDRTAILDELAEDDFQPPLR